MKTAAALKGAVDCMWSVAAWMLAKLRLSAIAIYSVVSYLYTKIYGTASACIQMVSQSLLNGAILYLVLQKVANDLHGHLAA